MYWICLNPSFLSNSWKLRIMAHLQSTLEDVFLSKLVSKGGDPSRNSGSPVRKVPCYNSVAEGRYPSQKHPNNQRKTEARLCQPQCTDGLILADLPGYRRLLLTSRRETHRCNTLPSGGAWPHLLSGAGVVWHAAREPALDSLKLKSNYQFKRDVTTNTWIGQCEYFKLFYIKNNV